MFVIGAGLEIFPAATLPSYAHRSGATLVFVNITATAYDEIADIILIGKAGEVMPQVLEAYRGLKGAVRD